MALTLDPTLAAAQDSASRRPIIELISSEFAADIPFDGQLLTSETTNESGPNLIRHTSGRLCLVYKYSTNQIKYVYTDEDRTLFSFVTLTIAAGHALEEAALCEMDDGDIGILYRTSSGTSHYLKYKTVTVTGSEVDSGDISTIAGSPTITGPAVIRLAAGTYLAVYILLVGTDYTFYKITSADFASWSAASALSVGGITTTVETKNPFLQQVTTGGIFLWFDYADVENSSNIYYSLSADDGANWANAVKVTDYDDASEKATHPVSAQKIAGQLYLIFNEEAAALRIDDTTYGWCGDNSSGTNISFDSTNRKLYVTATYSEAGAKKLHCVAQIDVDTWTISDCWGFASTPAFHPVFAAKDCWWQVHHGEGYLIPVGILGTAIEAGASDRAVVAVLNGEDDTITNYVFANWAAYSLTQNVNHSMVLAHGSLKATWLDLASRRLYCLFCGSTYIYGNYSVGYIDLTEPGPTYSFTLVVDRALTLGDSNHFDTGFAVYPGQDMILKWDDSSSSSYNLALLINLLSDGSEYKHYHFADFPSFPHHGIRHCVLVGNKVYGSFSYEPLYGQQDKRGLCEIDLTTDTISYHRPTWASIDDYKLEEIYPMPDGRLLIATGGYGITIYDPAADTWELFDNTTLPGMVPPPSPNLSFASVVYDEAADMIYGGSFTTLEVGAFAGAIAFSASGFLKRSHYMVGTYGDGSWEWGAATALVEGLTDYDLAAVFGPEAGDGLIVFWTNQFSTETSIKWDKEGLTLDLGSYLARGREISIARSIDGSPATLQFTVSHGHMFDPDNELSLLSPMLQKGRKVTCRMGENVGGTEYWANQGTFAVCETKMTYKRGKYPEMEVIARDRRMTWDHAEIFATEHYSDDPEDVLTDILKDHLDFALDEIETLAFDTSVPIEHQWVEVLAKDIVAQICNRFGYFPRITVDNTFEVRKISDANAVDHVYSDLTQLIDFTPDDSFSDFVNQITVIGHEAAEIETLYEEERIETISGTIGWWRREKDYTVYFSKDMSRRCRNPRLVVLESGSSAPFQLAGKVSESISYVDPNELYCVVTVEGPDLMPLLIAAIASITAALLLGDMVTSIGYGWTVPVGRYIQMIGLILALQVLGSICNFQYEVWARPLGKVRRSLQATWNDTELQAKIAAVVPWKFEEPLCSSAPQCAEVAAQEGLEKQLQRRRRKFTKIAHLQDEEGDTLQVVHPYTGISLKIFITEITRRMLLPELAGGEGYFLDDIEGWRL